MKVVTKILNILFVAFFLIGIASTICFIVDLKPSEQRSPYLDTIDSLNTEIGLKRLKLTHIQDSLDIVIQQSDKYYTQWQKEKRNLANEKARRKEQNKVKDLTIEQLLKYITDYYNTDSTEVAIVNDGDSIMVMVTPKLVKQVGGTIAEYRDNLELLKAYEIEITIADSLIESMTLQTDLLESKVDFLEDVTKDLNSKVDMLDKQLGLSKEEASKFKKQRNITGIVGIVLIVLVAL
jgi:hypothetical protein